VNRRFSINSAHILQRHNYRADTRQCLVLLALRNTDGVGHCVKRELPLTILTYC